MKTTKRVLAVVLAVMMVVAMVPMMAISASAEESPTPIYTAAELYYAGKNGGNYELMNDIDYIYTYIHTNSDLTIDGNGYTIKCANDKCKYMFYINDNLTLNLTNVTLDGDNFTKSAVDAAFDVENNDTYINFTNVTVRNFAGHLYVGAVNLYSKANGRFENCTFYDNNVEEKYASGATAKDIFVGAAATVEIIDCTMEELYLHGAVSDEVKATAYVSGNTVIDNVVITASGSYVLGAELNVSDGATVLDVEEYDKTWYEENGYTPSGSEATKTITDAVVAGVAYDEAGEAKNGITTVEELEAAAEAGGSYCLGADITVDKAIYVSGNLNLVGATGTTITSTASVALYLANENATLSMTNITLDGANESKVAIEAYTGNQGKNPNNIITLTDCTVKNFVGYSYAGAINSFGSSTTNLNNCTFTNNSSAEPDSPYSGGDVWAGAAAKININGGTLNEVYGNANNSSSANLTIDNATVGVINLGSTTKYTATVNIADTATVTKVNIDGKEAILTEDNKIIGAGGLCLSPATDDTFGTANPFTKNFELMGIQTKAEVENSLRFVSVIDAELLNIADDYGYIIGTTSKAKADAMTDAGQVTVDNASKYKVSCLGTSNSICGDYGKYDSKTSYKYITAAVENITNSSKTVFARVYVTVGDKTYYGDYINGSGTTYAGCATSLADLG